MGTRLRALKKKLGGEKLSEKKTINRKGCFTDSVLNKIEQFMVKQSEQTQII